MGALFVVWKPRREREHGDIRLPMEDPMPPTLPVPLPSRLARRLARWMPTLAAATIATAASAGRPLATDDAAVTETGRCQLEVWLDRAGRDRAGTAAVACGWRPGLEAGLDTTLYKPRDPLAAQVSAGLKWAPEAWRWRGPGGTWQGGLKLSGSLQRSLGGAWLGDALEVTGLGSLGLTPQVALHVNAGGIRLHQTGDVAATVALATAWTPHPSWLLFAETRANTRRGVFGGPVLAVGGRWWLQPETIGLDLAVSREQTAGAPTTVSVGFGWYGLGYRD